MSDTDASYADTLRPCNAERPGPVASGFDVTDTVREPCRSSGFMSSNNAFDTKYQTYSGRGVVAQQDVGDHSASPAVTASLPAPRYRNRVRRRYRFRAERTQQPTRRNRQSICARGVPTTRRFYFRVPEPLDMEILVDLPENTATALEARVESSEFDHIEEYIVFVLDEVTTPRPEFQDVALAESDRRSEVRDQLESLGYIE